MKRIFLPLVVLLPWLVMVPTIYAVEPYIHAGIGITQFIKDNVDGVWIQDRLPHTTNWTDLALRAGLGVRLHESWSVETNYVRLGMVKLQSVWQTDAIYDSRCGLACEHYHGNLWGSLQGGEFVGVYHPQWWHISPIVRVGVAGFASSVRWETSNQVGVFQYNGVVLATVVGAGACYHNWLCSDVSYYRGFAESNNPLSTSAVVSMVSLKYTF